MSQMLCMLSIPLHKDNITFHGSRAVCRLQGLWERYTPGRSTYTHARSVQRAKTRRSPLIDKSRTVHNKRVAVALYFLQRSDPGR